jgi:hypothetical protein
MMERLQSLPPEQRQMMLQRMRERGFDPTATPEPLPTPSGRPTAPDTATPTRERKPEATTIDALFGPLPPVETAGRVWRMVGGQLQPVRVRLGISDGQATELLDGDLEPGVELVTNVTTGEETRPAMVGPGAFPPFMGRPGGFPGGNRGGGSGGRGR